MQPISDSANSENTSLAVAPLVARSEVGTISLWWFWQSLEESPILVPDSHLQNGLVSTHKGESASLTVVSVVGSNSAASSAGLVENSDDELEAVN